MTDAQFKYTNRKRAWGPYKRHIDDLASDARDQIAESLRERLVFLFEQLKVVGTSLLIDRYVV
jgi:hypothetical protein